MMRCPGTRNPSSRRTEMTDPESLVQLEIVVVRYTMDRS